MCAIVAKKLLTSAISGLDYFTAQFSWYTKVACARVSGESIGVCKTSQRKLDDSQVFWKVLLLIDRDQVLQLLHVQSYESSCFTCRPTQSPSFSTHFPKVFRDIKCFFTP